MQLVPAAINYALNVVAPATGSREARPTAPSAPVDSRTDDGSDDADAEARRALEQRIVLRMGQHVDPAPTLLPRDVAVLISACSLAARVSIRSSALFIEAILEGARYSSLTGLGITRRAMIGAVTSARSLHYMRARLGWTDNEATESAYLGVLDHYTSLGVYVVHSVFSMTELFAMSGFNLTANLVATGMGAAEESVRLFDGIFGSNESSRALASIIAMVRRELTQDPNFPLAKKGVIATLSALTRALAAFACLQLVTQRQTRQQQRMRVVYDCTVVRESETIEYEPTLRLLAGVTSTALPVTAGARRDSLLSLQDDTSISNIRYALQTDFGSSRSLKRRSLASGELDEEDDAVAKGLADMLRDEGDDDRLGGTHGDDSDSIPDDVRAAIDRIVGGEDVAEDVQILAQQDLPGGHVELIRSRTSDQLYEIETVVTTTETRTVLRVGGRGALDGRVVAERTKPRAMAHTRTSRDLAATFSHGESVRRPRSGVEEHTFEDELEEQEWVEVSSLIRDHAPLGGSVADIPEAGNGASIGAETCDESAAHPEEGRQKLQVVLKTLTQRLTHRKRVLRKLHPGLASTATRSRSDVRAIEWTDNSSSTRTPSPTKRSPMKRILSAGRKRSTPPSSLPMSRAASEASLPAKGAPSRPLLERPIPARSSSAQHDPAALSAPLQIRSRRSNASLRSVFTTRTHVETTSSAPRDDEPKADNFPHAHLVANLRRYMRASSAAYGQTFMRIMGIGEVSFNYPSTEHHANIHAFAHHTQLPTEAILLSSFSEATSILAPHAPPLVHYIAIDHAAKAIVLTCRGTLGLSDILVDLTAHYEAVEVPYGRAEASYYAHSGMLASAKTLQRRQSRVHECLAEALRDWPTYGLVLTGHSLGGGVAALLSILLACPAHAFQDEMRQRQSDGAALPSFPTIETAFVTSQSSGLPAGRPVHCYCFGPPCVGSLDLCNYSIGLITCVVHNLDLVPCLSLGTLRDLKNVATSLWDEPRLAEEIVGRVVGLYQAGRAAKKQASSSDPDAAPDVDAAVAPDDIDRMSDEELRDGRTRNRARDPDYSDPALRGSPVARVASLDTEEPELELWALMKTIRAGNDAEKLFPPGTVYVVEWHTVFIDDAAEEATQGHARAKRRRREGRRVILRHAEDVTLRFSEPIFSKSVFLDHSPSAYEEALNVLAQAVLPK